MWCRHCKQDVPAVAPAADGGVQCARCQATLDRPAFAKSVSDAGVGLDQQSQQVVNPLRLFEEHETRGRHQELRRSIRSAKRQASVGPAMLRFDPPEPLVPELTADQLSVASTPRAADNPTTTPQPRNQHRPSQWIAWMLALLGAMALGVGLGLMFWSLTEARPDLWNWGLGATLGGQGLLILGLVQLLANLWNANREAAGALRGVQHELRRLGRTTETLVGAKSPTATSFYADLARGASPRILLANLKSQVDALTAHVSQD